MAERQWVTSGDEWGWLVVRYSNNTIVPALPQSLAVNYLRTEGGRDYFTIAEGLQAGRDASVRRKGDGSSYLSAANPQRGPAVLRYNRATREIFYAISGTITALNPDDHLPNGTYDIEIPDEVHGRLGGPFQGTGPGKSPYATTWFRISHERDRFLHPGTYTAGCLTVTDIPVWTALYNYLINSRKDDGSNRSVGTVEIFG